jgi:hypothetical protein
MIPVVPAPITQLRIRRYLMQFPALIINPSPHSEKLLEMITMPCHLVQNHLLCSSTIFLMKATKLPCRRRFEFFTSMSFTNQNPVSIPLERLSQIGCCLDISGISKA